MKFIANAGAFSAAISTVSRIVEARNTYPILANVILQTEDGRVTVRATDLDIEVTLGFEAKVDATGVTTVPAKTLDTLLRKYAKDAEVSFEHDGEAQATIKSGRSRMTLATLDPSSFPELKSGPTNHRFDVPAADLRRLIAKTSFAISNEETRYYLNGIFMHVLDGKLRGVATDGHRMARCDAPAPDGADGMPGIIVPKKTVAEIAKLIDKATEPVTVEVSETKIRVTVGGVTLLSKLIEGTFPDYDRVTPKNNDRHAAIDKASLLTAIDRVSTLASERGGKAVKMAITDGTVTLEVQNPDHGTAVEEIEGKYDQDGSLEIGFNARYLADMLGVIDGDHVAFCLNDAGSPTLIRSEGGDASFLGVLMPMRI